MKSWARDFFLEVIREEMKRDATTVQCVLRPEEQLRKSIGNFSPFKRGNKSRQKKNNIAEHCAYNFSYKVRLVSKRAEKETKEKRSF